MISKFGCANRHFLKCLRTHFYLKIFSWTILLACLSTSCQSSPSISQDRDVQNKIGLFASTVTARVRSTYPALVTPADALKAELQIYGIDPTKGQVGWIHPPASLQTKKAQQALFRIEYPSVVARDFLIAADITWETSLASSGCGFTLRVHGDGPNLNQYLVILPRLVNGYVLFTTMAAGEVANLREIYANGIDPNFSSANGATNRLAVLAQGNILTIYTNQVKLGEVNVTQPPSSQPSLPPTPQPPGLGSSLESIERYDELQRSYVEIAHILEDRYAKVIEVFKRTNPYYEAGYIGLAAVNSTGATRCEFKNAWLWIIEP